MKAPKHPIVALVMRFASRLRFPQLFLLAAALFLLDLLVPDLVPFVDEVLLGIGTILLGTMRKEEEASAPADRAPPPRELPGAASEALGSARPDASAPPDRETP